MMLCTIGGFAQKGTIKYLETRPGIYPIMLNESITKYLKDVEPIGKIENGNGYVRLDEDYCVLETANLLEVLATFEKYIVSNVLFYVSSSFKQNCFESLVKLYGEPKDNNGQYVWTSENYVLTYELNPNDLPEKRKGQAIGLFMRKKDLEK